MNGIILNGKVYEAVPKGSRHCSDCDLYAECKESWKNLRTELCDPFDDDGSIILKLAQPLTDKINEK